MPRRLPELKVTFIDPKIETEEQRQDVQRRWDDVFDILWNEFLRERKEKAKGSSTKKLNES